MSHSHVHPHAQFILHQPMCRAGNPNHHSGELCSAQVSASAPLHQTLGKGRLLVVLPGVCVCVRKRQSERAGGSERQSVCVCARECVREGLCF